MLKSPSVDSCEIKASYFQQMYIYRAAENHKLHDRSYIGI